MKLFNIALENFKGIRSFTLEPNGKDVTVYGANGIGKSTLADAYLWLLTGKDEFDRADYKILPTGEAEGVEASVTAKLQLNDGSSIVLRRVYKPVFTRKRGEAEKHRTGNTTDYYINDVPQKAGDYSKYISEHFGPEEDIMTVTRPEYFAQIIKPDVRRQKLLKLFADGVNDASVIAKHKELAPLGEQLGTYTVDDCVKRWKAQRKKVNDDKDAIPGRIDEAERAKPDEKNLNTDSARLPHLAAQRLQIRNKIEALHSGSAVSGAKAQLSKLQADMEQARGEYIRKSSGANTALENQIAAIRKEKAALQESLEQYNKSLKSAQSRIDSLNKEIPALRESVVAEYSKQFDTSKGVCPTCGRPYPPEKQEEMQGSFNEQKAHTISDMQQRGKNMVTELKKQTSLRDASAQSIQDVSLDIDHDQQKLVGLQKMLIAPPAWETTAEYTDWQKKICEGQSALKVASTAAESQIQKLQAELQPVESEMQAIQQRQANAALAKRQDERIAELKDEEKKLGTQLAKLDNMLHLAERFVQLKASDVEAEVNNSFQTIRWKLFDLQVNGGVKACCEAQVDGKDYGSLSKSEKVNAGLDIVNTLGQKMGLLLPVWRDDAESVCHPMAISAQVIGLMVSDEDKKLRVEERA